MKKVFKILSLVMLIITILKIGETYAKYFSEAHTATLNYEVGKWVIKINEMDLYSETGDAVEFEINNFDNFSNPHAAPDKISPSSTGYVDISIDPTGTEVAIRYDVELDFTTIDENLAMEVWLEMASGEETLVKTGPNTYSGIISLSEALAGNTADTRCYITWRNDETKNELDSAAGLIYGQTISLTVNVTVTQYLGEELVPYVENAAEVVDESNPEEVQSGEQQETQETI